MTQLSDLNLRHVDPLKLLFQVRHPAFPVEQPDWYESASAGGLELAPWLRGSVLATLETKFQKGAYFVVVRMMGLYISAEQEQMQATEFSGAVDSSTLDAATQEERDEFGIKVLYDLYPFVRSELYQLTGRLQGVAPVMLQPSPEIHVPDRSVSGSS